MAERLWAPWRFRYVATVSEATGCIFVDLPQQSDDRQNLILYRGKTAFVMLNRFPYTSGHLMIAPYRHTCNLEALEDDELLELNQLIRRSVRWLKATYKPDGFNIGVNMGAAAGAGIPTHVHWHVVPRWSGDTNFMTTVGDVRVMPQGLQESYDLLKKAIEDDQLG